MKKLSILLILTIITGALYSQSSPTISGEIKSTYGINFDFEEVRSGLREDFKFDLVWPLVPYEYKSEGENNKFSVETNLTGAVDLTILDHTNGWTQSTTPTWTVNFSNIYSKILYENFYFILGSRDTGYERVDGFNIERSTDKIRANWAYLTSRVAWSYLLNPDYNISGESDILNGVNGEQGSENSIGLGGDHKDLSWVFMFGTLNDWNVDEDNRYDIGYNVNYSGVENLTVNQGTFTRIKDGENLELGAGLGLEYRIPLTDKLALKPNAGADIFVTDLEEAVLKGTEVAYGVTLEWPGLSGYGDLSLQENPNNRGEHSNHRYSGVTISGINYIDGDSADNDKFNLRLSALDPREGGLVENLELAALVEVVDVMGISDDEYNLAFGLIADYTILDAYRPKVKAIMKTIDTDRNFPVEFSAGVDFVGLPFAELGIVYENDNLSTIEDYPGRVLISFKSMF